MCHLRLITIAYDEDAKFSPTFQIFGTVSLVTGGDGLTFTCILFRLTHHLELTAVPQKIEYNREIQESVCDTFSCPWQCSVPIEPEMYSVWCVKRLLSQISSNTITISNYIITLQLNNNNNICFSITFPLTKHSTAVK